MCEQWIRNLTFKDLKDKKKQKVKQIIGCDPNKSEGRAEDTHRFTDRRQGGDQGEPQEETWSGRLQLREIHTEKLYDMTWSLLAQIKSSSCKGLKSFVF